MNQKIIDGIIALSVAAASAIGGYIFGKETSDYKEKKRRKKLDEEEVNIAKKMNKGK